VAEVARRVREAQKAWAEVPIRERLRLVDVWRRNLAREADNWANLIVAEIGKPKVEAFGEIVSTLDSLRWTVRNAKSVLAERRLPRGLQVLEMLPPARLSWRPLGLIGMIGTWNYPFLLNAAPIAQALASGNGVLWKPSELASQTGRRLQESIEAAGFPRDLVRAVYGWGDVGQALLDAGIDKGFFTGGIPNGRRVLAELGSRGVPAVAELSGFDPAIVLPRTDPAKVARPLAWGAFVGAGQTCVAIKRIFVVGDPRPLAAAVADVARSLRLGDPGSEQVDLGPLISEAARDRFHARIEAAVAAGADVLAGGTKLDRSGAFYTPTVLYARDAAPEAALAGVFGPVVVVRGVSSTDEAIEAANASEYALAASVWGPDLRAAQAVAARLQAGMITINDAVAPSAHAGAPFGGIKGSGHGRTRGAAGLLEFVSPTVVHKQRLNVFRAQLYPYTQRTTKLIGTLIRILHGM
jgi:acyl-CoA reductase-like NAD-dependent aldehyde dehydrogenase